MTTYNLVTASDNPAAVDQQDANFYQSDPYHTFSVHAPKNPEEASNESKLDHSRPADGSCGEKIPNEAGLTQVRSSAYRSDRYSKRSRWLGNVKAYQDPIAKDSKTIPRDSKTTLRLLKLTWGKAGSKGLVFNLALPKASVNVEAPYYISWQHMEHNDMRLTHFEDIIALWKSHGLPNNELGLSKQLLKRVAAVAQNPFIGGSFLTPLALRYDILKDSRYSFNKSCLFLSFPYFAITEPRRKRDFRKGGEDHPVRSLLQTHYRLIDTTERDKLQIIKILDGTTLRQCTSAPEQDVKHLLNDPVNEIVHVPQMWALILRSNKLATIGPISELALQGSSIVLKQDETPGRLTRCSFVRISFLNGTDIEEVTYSRDHCSSWFGLMNKYSQIKKIIGENNLSVDMENYWFQIGNIIITSTTWVSVQESATGEILDILIKFRKSSLVVNDEHQLDPASVDDRFHDLIEDAPTDFKLFGRDNNDAMQEPALVVLPLLAWEIKDDANDLSTPMVTDQLLETIYSSLPALCTGSRGDHADGMVGLGHPYVSRLSTRSKISIVGKMAKEVADFADSHDSNCHTDGCKISGRFYMKMKSLLEYFVPKEHNPDSAVLQLYWGAIYELLRSMTKADEPENTMTAFDDCHRDLDVLNEQVDEISIRAEAIHRGVYYKRTVLSSHGESTQHDAICGSAKLLASMVDALGSIFDMIVQAVHDVRNDPTLLARWRGASKSRVPRYAKNACKLLETARDELIASSTGFSPDENVGPVLTPQAVLILLIERLVGGVYGSGNVDIITVFDECLAQLALKVRNHASRRLLQVLNAFEEEVTIIENVLDQQRKVLQDFRAASDPNSYHTPTPLRRLRFNDEDQAIERILRRIQSQKSICPDLKQRAKALAVQNIQLVETLQDDNSRAILIFTLITVLFLPLSFVAGFFGMNVAGINPTTSTTRHFWAVALPLTGGILVLCGFVLFAGEDFWFRVVDALGRWRMVSRRQGKR